MSLLILIKISVFPCALFESICLRERFIFNFELFLDSLATPPFPLRSVRGFRAIPLMISKEKFLPMSYISF